MSRHRHARPGGRTRHVAGVPNRTELEYARKFLEPRRLIGEIAGYEYEPAVFWLATLCTFRPDWIVTLHDGSQEVHEIKGSHIEDDAMAKIRIAARLFPEVPFYLCRRMRGHWDIKRMPSDQVPSRRLQKKGIRYSDVA